VYPAGQGQAWGDSTASAEGVAQLLARVVTGHLLSEAHQSLAAELMANVAEEQRWGVTAAFPLLPTPISVKDGWYPAFTGWRVTSAGFSSDETAEPMVVVALTRNQPSFEYGVETIQGAAAWVGRAVYGDAVEPVDPGDSVDAPATETEHFSPSADGLPVVEGVCDLPSELARRPGAWRCDAGDAASDPCFVPVSGPATLAVCGARPDGEGAPFVVRSAVPLDRTGPEDLRFPWIILLDDGTGCERTLGGDLDEDGDSASYACTDGTLILGPLQQTGAWAALRLDPNTFTTWTVRVTYAWY
jgi:hypothetical protein